MLSRRSLLKGVAGVTAAGVLLPREDVVRRFWRLDRAMLAAPETATDIATGRIYRFEGRTLDGEPVAMECGASGSDPFALPIHLRLRSGEVAEGMIWDSGDGPRAVMFGNAPVRINYFPVSETTWRRT